MLCSVVSPRVIAASRDVAPSASCAAQYRIQSPIFVVTRHIDCSVCAHGTTCCSARKSTFPLGTMTLPTCWRSRRRHFGASWPLPCAASDARSALDARASIQTKRLLRGGQPVRRAAKRLTLGYSTYTVSATCSACSTVVESSCTLAAQAASWDASCCIKENRGTEDVSTTYSGRQPNAVSEHRCA